MTTLKQDLVDQGFELIETHTAWVFLSKDSVWKIKKPVDYGFLDYTTLDKRRAACEAEVHLNGRLAPDVYRRVVPVVRDGAGRHHLRLEGEPAEPVVDYAVEMRRLSDGVRADILLERGQLADEQLAAVAAHLARFHESMPTDERISRYGTPDSVSRNVRENFEQTRDSVSRHVSPEGAREIEEKQTEFVRTHEALFQRRIAAGRIRDGHGDLRLEHVYFDDSRPAIIDCIEFNERFRYADVCADVAFLSMDLARLGRVDLAERFLSLYARESNDFDLYQLVDFYEGYRAYVRGKVASFLAADPGAALEVRAAAERQARRYYLLALSTGRASLLRPAVVAVGGVIASGKSTLAERIGGLMCAPVVEADRTRKALLGAAPAERFHDEAWGGAYSEEFTERVYAEVLRRGRLVLESGRPVVLDASFRCRAMRERARELARELGAPFFFVEARAPHDECRRRLQRRARGPSVSDGRLEIFDAFVAKWEEVDELAATEHIVVDTLEPLDQNVARLARALPAWPERLTA